MSGPLQSSPAKINSPSNPRLDPIDSKLKLSGRVCDLLGAEPDLHEHGEVLRHRLPPQVPLSLHRLPGA